MKFRKVNNITGWVVFFIAFATYFLTREARGSLWDCGEFVSCADKMQLPHPPGAPLFVLLGRFFIILFGDNPQTAASAVNFMSALASAGTILFLFWSVTHFARKLFVSVNEELDGNQLITVMVAGTVGALAYTFSDSFWYSAVEGEVYALSSFFTALVFWAMLKWEHADEKAGNDPFARARADRWIVFLFFMMGLSIGVHLLNLLTIPAIVMIYYYRRYTVTVKGGIFAFLIGCAITGLVQLGVIQYSMKAAGIFDVFFVNNMHMPFFSGFAIYFVLFAALITWLIARPDKKFNKTSLSVFYSIFLVLAALPFIVGTGSLAMQVLKFLFVAGLGVLAGWFTKNAGIKILKLGLWSYAFMMLGYFMYFTSMIRSNANPSIDMNNVDNPMNLVYYLSREQYGEAPLVYGPHFMANYETEPYLDSQGNQILDQSGNPRLRIKMSEGEMKYVKGANSYIPIGRDRKPVYKSSDMQLFPRIWDNSNDQGHADFYGDWLNLDQDPQTGQWAPPSYGDNIRWFFSYQMSHMYWRYFMWNFAGKQNDIQGLGNKRDGNWISGIPFIDNERLGDQSKLPETIRNNKAHNTLFLLPFLLGILGCVYQFIRNKSDWIVNFLLFFFTGIAVVLYLNQPGNQPRERDYAYVGSFYAFAIWIGLAVVALVKLAQEKKEKENLTNTLVFGGVLSFLIALMAAAPGTFKSMLITAVAVTALYVAFTGAVTFLLKKLTGDGANNKLLNIATAVITLITPLIMAQQEWDDHDRSTKLTAPDVARDYLESCAPNAILFTFGDNDTYPLWYAQEVEGIRPDIRIINNSLLGIDWYINQLRYKVNNADSLDVLWTPEQIEGHNREYMRFRPQGDQKKFWPLYEVMKDVLGKPYFDPDTKRDVGMGSIPVGRFTVPVDRDVVLKNGTCSATDSILSEMQFQLPDSKMDPDNGGLVRSDLIILNIIASNQWKRPIYFSSPYGELGFGQYLRKDGLAYRLVPVENKYPQQYWVIDSIIRKTTGRGTEIRDNGDSIFTNLENKFAFGGADNKKTYFDEENRRHILLIRSTYAEAAGNLADQGKKQEALQLLDKVDKGILPETMPYGLVSRYSSHNQVTLQLLEACYKAGNKTMAAKIGTALRKDLMEQRAYYQYMEADKPEYYNGFERTEMPLNEIMIRIMDAIEQKYNSPAPPPQPKLNETVPVPVTGGKPDSGKSNPH